MSVAPNAGVVDLDNFLPPSAGTDGVQGQVPKPLAGQQAYVLTAIGWAPGGGGGGGTVTSVAATGGTGISVTGSPITTSGTLNITNTAPDQTVVLTAGTGISTSGTYPNFTITNTSPSSGGTVTSVAATVPSLLSISGSPITSSGTLDITYSGIALPILNGGTGETTSNAALNALLPSQATNNGKVLSTDGTDTSWVAVSGTGTVTSVAATAGTGISVTGSPITTAGTLNITNTAPDQTVVLTGAGTTSISGTYPNFTITSNDSATGTVTSVAAAAGTGISITGSPITTSGTLNITNTAPDQTVVLTAGTGINTSGTYPNFTVTNSAPDQTVSFSNGTGISVTGVYPAFTVTNTSPSSGGTVTSVSGTGTVSGLTLSGTVTSSGNLTLGGAITGFAASGANTDITSVALTSGTITAIPTAGSDIVNKAYADAIASGIHFHESVNLATTAALPANTYNNGTSGVGATLTANANGVLSVDSTVTITSERILVKNEATGANNGVYVVTQVGSAGTPYILTRATDFDTVGTGTNQIDEGDFFLVTSGVANLNTAWVQQTAPPITVGTTAIVFQQFAAPLVYSAGTGLNESPAYTFNIANTGTAGTYGGAASVPVFTTNAQGQVTGVTNTPIAIAGSAVSGDITGNAANVTGTVALANGGSGQTTAQLAMNAFAGAVTSGSYLRGNGTNVVMNTIQVTDVPTLNQSTTGSAATLTTPRAIYGNNFNGSAALTQVIGSTYGGTGNGFTKFSGPTSAEKTFTLPDASSTIVVQGGALGTPSSGDVTNLTGTASININGIVGFTTPNTASFTKITLSAGTAFVSPLQFTAGPVVSSLSAGSFEYTGINFNGTVVGNSAASRGTLITEHFAIRTGSKTLTSNTAFQSYLGGGTGGLVNGTLGVRANTTYFFEASVYITGMSATSGNINFSLIGTVGTATFTSLRYDTYGRDTTTPATASAISGVSVTTSASGAPVSVVSTGTGLNLFIKGSFRISTAGTLCPSIALTTAAAATIQANSYFKCYPVGTDTVIFQGDWV